jgi:hypothetical protein
VTSTQPDKGEADIKATAQYRKFKALLRKVIKAPPLPQKWHSSASPQVGESEGGRRSGRCSCYGPKSSRQNSIQPAHPWQGGPFFGRFAVQVSLP